LKLGLKSGVTITVPTSFESQLFFFRLLCFPTELFLIESNDLILPACIPALFFTSTANRHPN